MNELGSLFQPGRVDEPEEFETTKLGQPSATWSRVRPVEVMTRHEVGTVDVRLGQVEVRRTGRIVSDVLIDGKVCKDIRRLVIVIEPAAPPWVEITRELDRFEPPKDQTAAKRGSQ